MGTTTRSARSSARADINVTPMIDVLLVLLVIFMIVTPIAQRGMDVGLPEQLPIGPCPPDTKAIVMTIDQTGGIAVNQIPVPSLAELSTLLRDNLGTRTDKTMFVRASGRVRYGTVVAAMDVAEGAGVDRIGIMTESDQS